jgi:hypothetical protein
MASMCMQDTRRSSVSFSVSCMHAGVVYHFGHVWSECGAGIIEFEYEDILFLDGKYSSA